MTPNEISTPPSVSWAQRNAYVFLTINSECSKPDIQFGTKNVSFKGICAPDQKLQQIDIPLYAEIDSEKCAYINKGRFIDIVLAKKKTAEPFWPTLTSDKKKHHWLKVDFERWQDEDDSGDDVNDIDDMFSSKLGDFGDENEKDDSSSAEEEDLPDIK